ncbi:hypothetical protein Caci_3530 [Catenulispora acidiphila DSM 44928]|uniref:Terpene synthase n=1 Tax=Catenulispora acidiphila (strain DSM 44928 / JCM 14897 / NBRC 102108 / NRRL B-24433 / ID139908) TaxID=479433 RepID=C7QAD7_CATAD|nr:terpene synthase family protein [Catenulispora acidiphila]ACU72436.1 hypothetical protein Caci_3530 [Catenulispora acidiphila DSM 44928]
MPADEITRLFDLPEFRLLPGERRAAWGPELDDHVIDFACRTGLLTTPAARRYYASQRIGTMCAYVVPGALSPRRYEIYGELMTWFFIYDDWAEQLGNHLSPQQVSGVTDVVHTWFAEDERDVVMLDAPLAQSMRGIWAKLQEDTSLEWRRRLLAETDGYLRTAAEEAILVSTGRVNSFGKASELRPTATAAAPVFMMAEHSYGIEIPMDVVRHPLVRKAMRAAAAAIAYGNDIIGLKSDLLRGIRDNLVLSLQQEYGGDLQLNVERAAEHYQRAAGTLTALREDPEAGGREDVAVFFQILEDWVYEGVKWQLRDTDRYSSTVRLTQEENPNQLLALAASSALADC